MGQVKKNSQNLFGQASIATRDSLNPPLHHHHLVIWAGFVSTLLSIATRDSLNPPLHHHHLVIWAGFVST
ncbi:MAG: hypothetical protein ACOC07_19200, partial [Coleofasciculus sp.]